MEAVVYFDADSGSLIEATNEVHESKHPYIIVKYSEVSKIFSGEETFDHYRVVLDATSKEYILESWYDKKIAILSWDENMYKIPKLSSPVNEQDFDVILFQNKKTNKWTFKINWNIFHILSRSNERVKQFTEFYITKSNDANVLLHTIRFNTDFIDRNGETVIDGVDFDENISVYCRKIFNSYAHIEL